MRYAFLISSERGLGVRARARGSEPHPYLQLRWKTRPGRRRVPFRLPLSIIFPDEAHILVCLKALTFDERGGNAMLSVLEERWRGRGMKGAPRMQFAILDARTPNTHK